MHIQLLLEDLNLIIIYIFLFFLQLINFPMICKICYETNFDKLKNCSNCMVVSYCCDDHKLKDMKSHGKICNQLKLHYFSFIGKFIKLLIV